MVEDIKTGNFLNREYELSYDDGQFNDNLTVILVNGSISYNNGTFLTINAEFSEKTPGVI